MIIGLVIVLLAIGIVFATTIYLVYRENNWYRKVHHLDDQLQEAQQEQIEALKEVIKAQKEQLVNYENMVECYKMIESTHNSPPVTVMSPTNIPLPSQGPPIEPQFPDWYRELRTSR